jgi:hypothetical protein
MTQMARRIHRARFDAAGSLDLSEVAVPAGSPDYQGIPVVALEFGGDSEAEHLYRQFVLLHDPGDVVTEVSPWVPLAGDDGPAGHAGHPLLEFILVSSVTAGQGHGPEDALGFVVCAQCEGAFVQHVSSSEWLALGSSVPEADDANVTEEPVVELAVAECDPDQVAWAELRAWRYAYTIAGADSS